MNRKLIVVLTVSYNDWREISGRITQGGSIAYLDCDQGRLTTDPIQGLRVMVIVNVEGREEDATDELCRILSQYDEYEKVIGLHGREYGFTRQCIDSKSLAQDIAIDDTECTTARSDSSYNRLLVEMTEEIPDTSVSIQNFDKLFASIRDKTFHLHSKIYDLLAAFLPFHLELQLEDKSRLPDLASEIQCRRSELDQYLEDLSRFLGGSNIQFRAAREHFEKLFQDVQSAKETSSINSEDFFQSFHTTYCNLRDQLFSCLNEVEVCQ